MWFISTIIITCLIVGFSKDIDKNDSAIPLISAVLGFMVTYALIYLPVREESFHIYIEKEPATGSYFTVDDSSGFTYLEYFKKETKGISSEELHVYKNFKKSIH